MRILLALLLLPACALARESSPDIEVQISRPARKLLKKQGGAFEDGLFGCKAGKPLDLTSGGGALAVVPHPSEKEHLAIGAYQHGKRYAAFETWCEGATPVITPLNITEAEADKLFPAKFGDEKARFPTVSAAAREAMLDRGYVIEKGVLKKKGAKTGYDVNSLTGRGHVSVEAKPGKSDQLYAARFLVDEFQEAAEITLEPSGPKVRGIGPSAELRKLFAPTPDEVVKP